MTWGTFSSKIFGLGLLGIVLLPNFETVDRRAKRMEILLQLEPVGLHYLVLSPITTLFFFFFFFGRWHFSESNIFFVSELPHIYMVGTYDQ
jgi:hypothetical protein